MNNRFIIQIIQVRKNKNEYSFLFFNIIKIVLEIEEDKEKTEKINNYHNKVLSKVNIILNPQ